MSDGFSLEPMNSPTPVELAAQERLDSMKRNIEHADWTPALEGLRALVEQMPIAKRFRTDIIPSERAANVPLHLRGKNEQEVKRAFLLAAVHQILSDARQGRINENDIYTLLLDIEATQMEG